MDRRVLFVCAGNTCRSPMAVAAAGALANALSAESAGVTAVAGDSAKCEAVDAVRSRYGIDISDHETRPIESVDLGTFDVIVAMSGSVAEKLERQYAIPQDRSRTWEIEDPWGKGKAVYEETLDAIEANVERLVRDLDAQPSCRSCQSGSGVIGHRKGQIKSGQPLTENVERLRQKISIWREEDLSESPAERLTLLDGIWKRADGYTETILRGALQAYLNACQMSFQEAKREFQIRGADSVEDLSLGGVGYSFRKLSETIADGLDGHPAVESNSDSSRTLVDKSRPTLKRLSKARNPFTHHREPYFRYADDAERMRRKIAEHLGEIEELLDGALIQVALELDRHHGAARDS